MTAPFSSNPDESQTDVPVVPVAPILPWQEPLTLSYRVVEIPAKDAVPGNADVPPPEWIFRPPSERPQSGAAQEEDDASPYALAEVPTDDQVELRRRRRADLRSLEQLILAKQQVRRPRREARRETHWYQCLAYPFLAWRLLLGLALMLGLATTWLALLLPGIQHLDAGDLLASLPLYVVMVGIPVVLLSYGCAFLQCVLSSAVAGDPPHVCWPGQKVHIALLYSWRWLVCFLAGPAFFLGGAVLYWINCGELEFLDRLILVELGVVGIGYWLFALLAVTRHGRLRDANPLRVIELAHRLKYRSAVAIVVASFLAYAHGRWGVAAVEEIHLAAFGGWLFLNVCWLSALSCATFLLRLVGLWCYYCLQDRSTPATPLAA